MQPREVVEGFGSTDGGRCREFASDVIGNPLSRCELCDRSGNRSPTRRVSYATVKSALSDEAGKRKPQVVRGAESGYRLVRQDAD